MKDDIPTKEPSTFDYLDSINQTKEDIMTPDNEKKYQPYLINHFLSGTIDTVVIANEMNQKPFLDNRLQYDFLKSAIRGKRRRTKWLKPDQIENLKLVQRYYGYGIIKAKEALRLLSVEQIEGIKDFLNPGGAK